MKLPAKLTEAETKDAKDEDEHWMNQALRLARRAGGKKEVPVGALVVINHRLISVGFNLREALWSPLGHAEVIAIHRACQRLKTWRLPTATTLYSTLEPCLMCTGLLLQARIGRLVFGAEDSKGGGLFSLGLASPPHLGQNPSQPALSPQQGKVTVPQPMVTSIPFPITTRGGVLKEPCSQLLTQFFQELRRDSL